MMMVENCEVQKKKKDNLCLYFTSWSFRLRPREEKADNIKRLSR